MAKKTKKVKAKKAKNAYTHLLAELPRSHGEPMAFGQDIRWDDHGISRVRCVLPVPTTKVEAEALVFVLLERAERIYRDELTGGAPPAVRKVLRGPGKQTIEAAQAASYRFGLSAIPSAKEFKKTLAKGA